MKKRELKVAHIHTFGGLALVLLGAMSFAFGVRPFLNGRESLAAASAAASDLLSKEKSILNENEELKSTIEAIRAAQSNKFQAREIDRQPVLELMSTLLSEREIQLSNFREKELAAEKAIEAELQIEGQYEDFAMLLDDLRTLRRPNRIKSMSLKAIDAQGKTCSVRLVIKFFEIPKLFDQVEDHIAAAN